MDYDCTGLKISIDCKELCSVETFMKDGKAKSVTIWFSEINYIISTTFTLAGNRG